MLNEKALLEVALIERLQQHVLVNSVIYYRLGNNILSDAEFDKLSRSAAKFSNERRSRWFYVMFDHDAESGTEALLGRLHQSDWEYISSVAQSALDRRAELQPQLSQTQMPSEWQPNWEF